MMARLWIVAAMAILGIALGGCGDTQPITPLVAEPETVGTMPDGGGEQTEGCGEGGTEKAEVAKPTPAVGFAPFRREQTKFRETRPRAKLLSNPLDGEVGLS
jgi:hypothetical protein